MPAILWQGIVRNNKKATYLVAVRGLERSHAVVILNRSVATNPIIADLLDNGNIDCPITHSKN